MPDSHTPADLPRNWSDALAALPLETPQRDAWPRLASELRTRRQSPLSNARGRRLPWLALAAAVALALALPLAWLPGRDEAPSTVAVQATGDGPEKTAAASDDTSADGRPVEPAGTAPASGTRPDAGKPATVAREPARAAHADPQNAPADETELARLYAQSTQLEILLSQVQDDRVATGPAAVLAGEFEAQLATIDAALSDPALAVPQRIALWQERIGTLQQLAGFHSAQRLLAAQGERYDGQLVAVY